MPVAGWVCLISFIVAIATMVLSFIIGVISGLRNSTVGTVITISLIVICGLAWLTAIISGAFLFFQLIALAFSN